MVEVLTDADVRRLLTPSRAIGWMREALIAQHRGELRSPPRVHADLGDGRLVFTTGAMVGKWFGYRSYDSFAVEPGEQVVVVHHATDGRVRGIAVGNELGPRRVGAIGGVAAYDPPNILVGTPQEHRLISLGAALAGDAPDRPSDDQRIVFCSVGLAGTEVFLLDRLIDCHEGIGP